MLRGENPEDIYGCLPKSEGRAQSLPILLITSSLLHHSLFFEDEKKNLKSEIANPMVLMFRERACLSLYQKPTSYEDSALRSRKLRLSRKPKGFIICQLQAGTSRPKRPRGMIGTKSILLSLRRWKRWDLNRPIVCSKMLSRREEGTNQSA